MMSPGKARTCKENKVTGHVPFLIPSVSGQETTLPRAGRLNLGPSRWKEAAGGMDLRSFPNWWDDRKRGPEEGAGPGSDS